jgi:hypothetical protein
MGDAPPRFPSKRSAVETPHAQWTRGFETMGSRRIERAA